MKLSEYFDETKEPVAQFAERIGAHRTLVYNWLRNKQKPEKYYDAIMEATDGKVTPNDFYGITPHEDAHG